MSNAVVSPLILPHCYVELTLLCQCHYQTAQQTRGSTRHQKSSRADEDALVSEMLGGASRQPTVASGWDEDLFTPMVGCK